MYRLPPKKLFILTACLLITSCASSYVRVTDLPRPMDLTRKEVAELKKLRSLEAPITGPWKNRYQGDPVLAGVEISQAPREGQALVDYSDLYAGKQPAEISYHFWDGRVRSMHFGPDGKTSGDEWHPSRGTWDDRLKMDQLDTRSDIEGYLQLRKHVIAEAVMPYIESLAAVDFTLGSDPEFIKHKDPRASLIDALNQYEQRMTPRDLSKARIAWLNQ